MAKPKGRPQRKSARAETKREPLEIEVIFPDPIETEQPDSPAKPADQAVEDGSPRAPQRVIFRF